jgi:hypothetical protein
VGDGILIHGDKNFFAVGDGSDRNPRAARRFMERFSQMLDGIKDLDPKRTIGDEASRRVRETLTLAAGGLLKEFSPGDGCTFTGILLLHTTSGLQGLMFHTGDSLLYRTDTDTGVTVRLAANNFWLVGRTDRFYQVEQVDLCESSRLLLATDGFDSLLTSAGGAETLLGEIFRQRAVDLIPDLLFDLYDRPKEGLDDASVLCLSPAKWSEDQPWILLGGTSAEEESRRRTALNAHRDEDRYEELALAPGKEDWDWV